MDELKLKIEVFYDGWEEEVMDDWGHIESMTRMLQHALQPKEGSYALLEGPIVKIKIPLEVKQCEPME